MLVSPKLGQKGRELKQRARDKAADKSVLLSALCLGVSPRLRLTSFLCGRTLFQCCPAWSDLLTSGRETPGEAPSLCSIMNPIQGLDAVWYTKKSCCTD